MAKKSKIDVEESSGNVFARRSVPRALPQPPHSPRPSGYRGVSDHMFWPLALPSPRPARWSLTPRLPVAADLSLPQLRAQ
jgi:hypothetical protein